MTRAPTTTRRGFFVLAGGGVLACAAACAGGGEGAEAQAARAPSPGRCAHCGMRVTRGAAFSSGALEAGGTEVVFDSVKCMFRWLGQHTDARDPWVTEHLTRTQRPARAVFFVLGTDIQGPMGPDLLPVESRERADQLRESHHGTQVLAFDEVTSSVIDGLFRM